MNIAKKMRIIHNNSLKKEEGNMELLKEFSLKLLIPMVLLAGYSFVLVSVCLKLQKAWKDKNFKIIWFNIWLILIGLYFLLYKFHF